MALLARPIRYIVSGLPTSNSATAGRRPLTPRTTTQVRLLKQLLDKLTGALLVLPLLQVSANPPLLPAADCGRLTRRSYLIHTPWVWVL